MNKPEQYNKAVEDIKTAILQGQYEAAKGVNRIQLAVYFAIGKYISLNTRNGAWGTGALKQISERLRKELPGLRGFSETQLRDMRRFYEAWIILDGTRHTPAEQLGIETGSNSAVATAELPQPISTVTTAELQTTENEIDIYHAMAIPDVAGFPVEDFFAVPFTHHTKLIFLCKEQNARYYYLRRTAQEHLSVEKMEALVKSDAFKHQETLPNNFMSVFPNSNLARKAVMMFKDEYLLDFINVEQIGERESIDVDEREVEQQIIQNIKNFILTFGKDFAFIGNQYHLEVYGVEHFPDLLFFNRELNALVVVELKTGDFKSSYLGQLMSYLSILDAKVKKPHENPSIVVQIGKARLCGVRHPRLQQAYGCGHLQNHSRNA